MSLMGSSATLRGLCDDWWKWHSKGSPSEEILVDVISLFTLVSNDPFHSLLFSVHIHSSIIRSSPIPFATCCFNSLICVQSREKQIQHDCATTSLAYVDYIAVQHVRKVWPNNQAQIRSPHRPIRRIISNRSTFPVTIRFSHQRHLNSCSRTRIPDSTSYRTHNASFHSVSTARASAIEQCHLQQILPFGHLTVYARNLS